ncbi:MAG TPA: hypothetical protein VFY18_10370, partial [Candidatus Limnocylindrales bacterium]|nr:hypothetical protein [Candidatus Limnocylindrales bacterium]
IVYSVTALLLSSQIVPVTRTGFLFELVNSLTLNAIAELVLAVTGIAIVGSAARIQNGLAMLALFTSALPVVAVLWFLSYATLGGALGSPF